MSRRAELLAQAGKTVQGLFLKYGITDPNQAKRLIRERANPDDLDAYYDAIRTLDKNGGIG